MRKLFLSLSVIVLVSALLFTSCSAPAPAPAPQPTPGTAPAPTSKPAPTPAAGQTYKWRLQVFMPPVFSIYANYLNSEVKGTLAQIIKERTGGRVEITTYSGGQLVPPTEIFKSTADGIVEMGYSATSYHIGFIPVGAVADGLPMSFREPKDQVVFFYEKGFGDLLRTEYAKQGVHLLTIFATDPYAVLSKKPLVTKTDWQGVKIRGWGAWNKFFAKLGASPVDMPLMEVYSALSSGTIDGAITGVIAHHDGKTYEVCKSGLLPYLLGSASHDIYINLKLWNTLPNDLKDTIQSVCREWTYNSHVAYTKEAVEKVEKLKSFGVKWVETQDKDWLQQNAMTFWDEAAAKDAPSAKAVNMLKDYLKAEGALK